MEEASYSMSSLALMQAVEDGYDYKDGMLISPYNPPRRPMHDTDGYPVLSYYYKVKKKFLLLRLQKLVAYKKWGEKALRRTSKVFLLDGNPDNLAMANLSLTPPKIKPKRPPKPYKSFKHPIPKEQRGPMCKHGYVGED
jgi:hypothetical protein